MVREAAKRKLGMRHFDVQVFDYTLYYAYTCTLACLNPCISICMLIIVLWNTLYLLKLGCHVYLRCDLQC